MFACQTRRSGDAGSRRWCSAVGQGCSCKSGGRGRVGRSGEQGSFLETSRKSSMRLSLTGGHVDCITTAGEARGSRVRRCFASLAWLDESPKHIISGWKVHIWRFRTGSMSWILASPSRKDSTVARMSSTPAKYTSDSCLSILFLSKGESAAHDRAKWTQVQFIIKKYPIAEQLLVLTSNLSDLKANQNQNVHVGKAVF